MNIRDQDRLNKRHIASSVRKLGLGITPFHFAMSLLYQLVPVWNIPYLTCHEIPLRVQVPCPDRFEQYDVGFCFWIFVRLFCAILTEGYFEFFKNIHAYLVVLSIIRSYVLYPSLLVAVGPSSYLIVKLDPLTNPKSMWKFWPWRALGKYILSLSAGSSSRSCCFLCFLVLLRLCVLLALRLLFRFRGLPCMHAAHLYKYVYVKGSSIPSTYLCVTLILVYARCRRRWCHSSWFASLLRQWMVGWVL